MVPSQGQKRKRSVGVEDAPQTRRSHRTNLGKNGRNEQLKKVSDVLEKKANKPRSAVIPGTVPFNPMAPVVSSRSKSGTKQRKKARTPGKTLPSEKDMDVGVDIPDAVVPSFRVAGEGERFGFHASQRNPSPHNDDDREGDGDGRPHANARDDDDGEEDTNEDGRLDADFHNDDDGAGDANEDGRRDTSVHHDRQEDDYEDGRFDDRVDDSQEEETGRSEPLWFPPSTPPAEGNTKDLKVGHRSVNSEDFFSRLDAPRPRTKDLTRRTGKSNPSRSRGYPGGVDDDHRSRKAKVVHQPHKVSSHRSRNSRPVGSDDILPHDVLERHQFKNGRLRPPSPARLQRIRSNTANPVPSRRLSSPDEDEIKTFVGNRLVLSEDPTCLNFYPPLTRAFLRRCKLLVRAHYATRDPFITLASAVQGVGLEILAEVHVEYQQKRLALEEGQYPEYRHSMARLLYNENGNFRSELKRAAMAAVRQHYNELQIPEGMRLTAKQGIEYVKRAAFRLLQNGEWLRGPPDENGKLRNFSHNAIKHACLALYYKSSSRTSLKSCKEFSTAVPASAIGLIAAAIKVVLVAYRDHGEPKVPTLNEDSCSRALHNANKGVREVLAHPEHAMYFKSMIRDWVQQERFGEVVNGLESDESDPDFTLVLD